MRITATLLVAFTAACGFRARSRRGAGRNPPLASSGQVTSAEEGAMEGVVVSAKRTARPSPSAWSPMPRAATRSRRHGSSPANTRCQRPRQPAIQLPGAPTADVAAGQEAKSDLKLTKLRSLSAHLTNAEWMHSMPGTEQQKKFLLNCIGCHTLERIMKSSYDAESFIDVINRMATYYPGTTPLHPQRLGRQFPAHARPRQREADRGVARDDQSEPAGHLAVPAQDPAAADRKIHARSSSPNTTCRTPRIQPHDVVHG